LRGAGLLRVAVDFWVGAAFCALAPFGEKSTLSSYPYTIASRASERNDGR
jgi:hypothetical protein